MLFGFDFSLKYKKISARLSFSNDLVWYTVKITHGQKKLLTRGEKKWKYQKCHNTKLDLPDYAMSHASIYPKILLVYQKNNDFFFSVAAKRFHFINIKLEVVDNLCWGKSMAYFCWTAYN